MTIICLRCLQLDVSRITPVEYIFSESLRIEDNEGTFIEIEKLSFEIQCPISQCLEGKIYPKKVKCNFFEKRTILLVHSSDTLIKEV